MNHKLIAFLAQAKHQSLALEARRAKQVRSARTSGKAKARMTFGR